MRWQSGHNTRPDSRLPPTFIGMDAWMNSQSNAALARKLRRSLVFLACIFDVLAIGVFTTRHWMTSGRPVQGSNVCTVLVFIHLRFMQSIVQTLKINTV